MLAITTKTIEFKDVSKRDITVLEDSLIEILPEADEFGLYIAEYYGFLFTISQEEFRLLC
jgi:hypothetical protein